MHQEETRGSRRKHRAAEGNPRQPEADKKKKHTRKGKKHKNDLPNDQQSHQRKIQQVPAGDSGVEVRAHDHRRVHRTAP